MKEKEIIYIIFNSLVDIINVYGNENWDFPNPRCSNVLHT